MIDILFNTTMTAVRTPQPVLGLFGHMVLMFIGLLAVAAIGSHPFLATGVLSVVACILYVARRLS